MAQTLLKIKSRLSLARDALPVAGIVLGLIVTVAWWGLLGFGLYQIGVLGF
jgi:hypothetical protein